MKKINLLIILLLTFLSCSDDSIKCDGALEKATVISILKDEIFKQKFMVKQSLGIDENYLNKFFENNLELSLVRTTAKNKELKSCDCSARLGLKLKKEIIDFSVENAKGTGNNLEFAKERIRNMLNIKVDIEYSIQEKSDDFIVETSVPSDLGKLLGTSFLFESNYNKKEFELKKDKIYTFGNGSEDCSYEIWFILSPRNNEVKGGHTQNCIGDNGAGERKFTGVYENGRIKANINNKEYFELEFNGKEMEYILTKTILENGKEMTFSEHNTITYELIK